MLTVNDLTIDFPLYSRDHNFRSVVLRGAVGGFIQKEGHSPRCVVRALKGITFSLQDGDRLGLIGHNGAGKTTLLQALAGIYEPVRGSVKADGRISCLLTSNLGMDGDETGFQNITTCGLVLGMSMKEIARKRKDIEEFTDLSDFLQLPVRTYSAGMQMRLAFAITTSIDPDILLLDEGLGAGDAAFQKKAQRRISELMARTKVMILASHSDGNIRQMCNKAMLLEHGSMIKFGPVDEVCEYYNARVNG